MVEKSIKCLAEEFKLPFVGDGVKIWFFRTQSGLFYHDFFLNRYIALGWDLVRASMITDPKNRNDDKKSVISELYPDEKRPGLILGQMDTFYNKMCSKDLVLIPSEGTQRVAIGVIGDIVSDVEHKYPDDEYKKCEYTHKRTVKWIKEVDLWTDVYLLKVLRAQQTISDITEYAELVYRNLYPCYISADGLHLMLRKKSSSEYHIKDSIDLQSAVLKINSIVSGYYEFPDAGKDILVKTAVGSPGFIEFILPRIPTSVITVVCVIRAIIGKTTTKEGEINTGLMAVLTKGNELLNDHTARQKTKAEIRKLEADTAYTNALTRKTNAEAQTIEIENDKRMQKAVSSLSKETTTIKTVSVRSGVELDKPLGEVS